MKKTKWLNESGEEMSAQEMLTKAIVLELIADGVEKAKYARKLEKEFSKKMTQEDVEVCKDAALMIFEHTLSEHNMERILH